MASAGLLSGQCWADAGLMVASAGLIVASAGLMGGQCWADGWPVLG